MKTSLLFFAILLMGTRLQAGERLDSLFGNEEAQAVVAKPTKVQAYRLPEETTKKTVKDYKMIAGPVAIDDALAKSLGQLLLDEKSYSWDTGKACDPLHGVRLEFIQGEKTTDVFFCFSCDILAVYVNGKSVGSADFDAMRPHLVKIMQRIFPDDKAIQGLKARKK